MIRDKKNAGHKQDRNENVDKWTLEEKISSHLNAFPRKPYKWAFSIPAQVEHAK